MENWDSRKIHLYKAKLEFQPRSERLPSCCPMTMPQDRNYWTDSTSVLRRLARSSKVPTPQVLDNEIWSPGHVLGSVFQNVIIESEGKKSPRGSRMGLEHAQSTKAEHKIVSLVWLQPCGSNLCIGSRMGRELGTLYLFVWVSHRLLHFHVIFIQ